MQSGQRVHFEPGTGILRRTGDIVVFSPTHDPAFVAALDDSIDSPNLFAALAKFVANADFDCCAFVAVLLDQRRLLVFGDMQVQIVGPEVSIADGATTATWLEGSFDEYTTGIQAGTQGATYTLGDGLAPAGGMTLIISLGPPAKSEPGAPETADVDTAPATVPEEPPASPARVETSPPQVESDPSASPTPAIDEATDPNDLDWDPLAQPVDIDLERLGDPVPPAPSVPVVVAELVDEPGATFAPPVVASGDAHVFSLTGDAEPVDADSTEIVDVHAPAHQLAANDGTPGLIAGIACTQFHPNPPGISKCRQCGERFAPNSPVVMLRVDSLGRLEFDDGQSVSVDGRLAVGRNPGKAGLGDEVTNVVIRSEQVSRLHWQIVVDGWAVRLIDAGSRNGTMVQRPGHPSPEPAPQEHGIELEPGAIITFADRSATFRPA